MAQSAMGKKFAKTKGEFIAGGRKDWPPRLPNTKITALTTKSWTTFENAAIFFLCKQPTNKPIIRVSCVKIKNTW